eukprot:UN10971
MGKFYNSGMISTRESTGFALLTMDEDTDTESIFDKYFNTDPEAFTAFVKRYFKKKLWVYFHDVQCQNESCRKNYCLDKYGIQIKEGWISNIEDKLDPKVKWYICKGCHLAFYCSRRCRKRNWSQHKKICQNK